MPAALVTGATGLVGSYIVERLLADGWRVRALVREPSRGEALSRVGVELHPGDILDAGQFAAAARGVDVVFHAAAAITPPGGWEEFWRVNTGGTWNAVAAAGQAGARLLQVSSVGVYGPSARYATPRGKTDEDVALQPLPEGAFYARSKRESEEVALSAHERGEVWATAVRPSVVYGRRDRQFVPRVARLLRGGFAPIINGGRSTLAIVHAANVADGAVRAAATDVAGGKAYNIANDFDVTVSDFFRLAAEGLGRRVRLVPVPMPLARAALAAVRTVGPMMLGSRMNVVTESSSLDFITRDNPFSSERARRDLGWTPAVRPEVGIPDAFRWWAAHQARRPRSKQKGATMVAPFFVPSEPGQLRRLGLGASLGDAIRSGGIRPCDGISPRGRVGRGRRSLHGAGGRGSSVGGVGLATGARGGGERDGDNGETLHESLLAWLMRCLQSSPQRSFDRLGSLIRRRLSYDAARACQVQSGRILGRRVGSGKRANGWPLNPEIGTLDSHR